MLTRKPFKHELNTTRDVLEWVKAHLEKNEPGAYASIGAYQQVLDDLPTEDDIEEMTD